MNYISVDNSFIELSITGAKHKLFPAHRGIHRGEEAWAFIDIFCSNTVVYVRNSIYMKFQ